MTLIDAVILGLVQGLTEFLPVSSSGHLVLFGHYLGVGGGAENVLFDVILHAATLAAVLVVYAKDACRSAVAFIKASLAVPKRGIAAFGFGRVQQPPDYSVDDARLALFVVIASIPTGIVGVAFKDTFESLFAEPRAAAYALFVTAAVLFVSRFIPRFVSEQQTAKTSPGVVDALLVGLAQSVAIIPGISRSGSTITCALWRGLDAQSAARASFLMSVPAILGALLLQLRHVDQVTLAPLSIAAGAVVAFISGTVAILLVIRILRWQGFWYFGFYCLLAGGLGIYFTG